MRKSLEGKLHVRRGAGVVERDGFEIRCTCKGTQGSSTQKSPSRTDFCFLQ